jgi:putative Ca2+/H+ antiporter (TMEM165/GDT1 family)
MEALLVSTGLVALAEIGDKTMLLAIVLAARWRKPWPIIAGILVATLLNHALASSVGVLAARYLDGPWMRYVIGVAFLAFAAWALIPDRFEDDEAPKDITGGSVLLATAIAFFLVEMGDKTQVATVALAAQFQSIALVATGTTLGMMIANVPAVFLGEAMARRVPLRYVRWAAAGLFAGTGVWVLVAG